MNKVEMDKSKFELALREKLLKIITPYIDDDWHGEGYPVKAELIVDNILSLLEPVELEALGDEESLKLAKEVFGTRDGIRPIMPSRGDSIQRYSEEVSQATIQHNQSKGQLYRVKEGRNDR